MHPLAGARTRAYLRDCAGYLGLAAATVPLGVVVNRRGTPSRGAVLAMSAIPPVAATLLAAARDARRGTPGHRRTGLVVLDDRGLPPAPGRALVRNVAKIGVPWQLGHVVALGASYGGFRQRDRLTLAAAALVYPWLPVAAAFVLTGRGLGLHDRAAGTRVARRP